MKSFNQLARIAYAAYLKRSGATEPLWAGLSVETQACWIKAVEQMVAEFRQLH
jgi:hypothetical protein